MLVHFELTIAAALAHALFAVNLTNVIICDIYLIKNALHLFLKKYLQRVNYTKMYCWAFLKLVESGEAQRVYFSNHFSLQFL